MSVPDEQDRLKAYLEELHPMVAELRRNGWPAEAYVQSDSGKLIVWMKMDLRDTRIPEEAVIRE